MTSNKKQDFKLRLGAMILNHWWKVILIILVAGIAISGFNIKCGDNSFTKQPIKIKQPAKG